jgi:hypothetical protein
MQRLGLFCAGTAEPAVTLDASHNNGGSNSGADSATNAAHNAPAAAKPNDRETSPLSGYPANDLLIFPAIATENHFPLSATGGYA